MLLCHLFICIQRETRRVYNLLLDDAEANFMGWTIEQGYSRIEIHYMLYILPYQL